MNPRITLLLLLLLPIGAEAQNAYKEYFKIPAEQPGYVSPTKYNWSKVAASLTENCASDYARIHAIYTWITRNISYDTSYSIKTADECFDAMKGVCQAYSELFYRIAEAAGLRVEIVCGQSMTKKMGLHAWIFAYTRENYGILLDPTWGAGYVDGDSFFFRMNHDIWFNVDPEWMILTHLPDNPSYQLVDKLVTQEEFEAIHFPSTSRMAVEYGIEPHQIYKMARKNTLSLPVFYAGGEDVVLFNDIPLRESLTMGNQYTFRITVLKLCEVILTQNGVWYTSSSGDWNNEGDGVYSIVFSPKYEGSVCLGISDGTNQMLCLVNYKVAAAK